MRLFTLIVSAIFVAEGVWLSLSGERLGWTLVGFFGLCLLVAIFEPWFPKPWADAGYSLLITGEDVTCVDEFRRRRESIRWDQVIRIWYVTTSKGPYVPDEWLLLEGESGGCAFPTEAKGFKGIWDELKARFPGFDYAPIIHGGTEDRKYLCWERGGNAGAAGTAS